MAKRLVITDIPKEQSEEPEEVEKEEIQPRTTITVKLYNPVNSLPETHRPQVTFEGEMVSRRSLEDIHFHMIKAVRLHKAKAAQQLNSEKLKDEGGKDE